MDKQKKTLIIGGIVEGAILVFDLIISIIVGTTLPTEAELADWGLEFAEAAVHKNGDFIGFFQGNPTAFFCIICIPLFVIIAADFVYFAVMAAKKESRLSEGQLEAIRQKAKEQAEREILAELEREANNPEPEEEAPEQPEEK